MRFTAVMNGARTRSGSPGRVQVATAQARRGAAMVELAVIFLIFVMMLLGITEFGHAFMVANAAISAAREGGRLAAVSDDLAADDARVRVQAMQRLSEAGIFNGVVGNTRPGGPGDNITVTVTVPYQSITKLFNMNFPMIQSSVFRYEGNTS